MEHNDGDAAMGVAVATSMVKVFRNDSDTPVPVVAAVAGRCYCYHSDSLALTEWEYSRRVISTVFYVG